jgi:hypothetical protein
MEINKMDKFYLKTCTVSAAGILSDGKFIVLNGSKARKELAPSFPKTQIEKREELISSGVLVDNGKYFVFSENYSCKSPSEASNLITGTSSNGPMCWKDSFGKTLKSCLRTQL